METIRNLFSNTPAVYTELEKTFDKYKASDLLANLGIDLAKGVAVASLPYPYNILGMAIGNLVKTGRQEYMKIINDELFKYKESALTESAKKEREKPIRVQPKIEQASKETFEGFGEGNVILFGVTQSGKTTSFVTWLYNDLIKEFDMCILVGSDLLKQDKIQEIRTGVQYALMKQSKEYNQDVFAFFNRNQLDDALDFAIQKNTDKRKIIFFDDIQLDNARKFDKVAMFTQECKHAKCTAYVSMHMTFNDKSAEIIRSSAKYFAMFNQHEQNFNRLLKLEKGNRLWRKYNGIVDIHDRVLIHDITTSKNFYGSFPYARMDPLIASDDDGNL